MLYLLWALPALGAVFLYAGHRRKQALLRFAERDLLKHINTSISAARRRTKALLLLAGFALAVIALARPAWNMVEQEVEQRGRDVVFVLDVSKSMLAEDLSPNRLERAKLAIRDSLERLQGDRVALVLFAGTAVVKCPLTHDYGFFRMAIDEASPASVSRGGTLIGDAIRTTIRQVFDNQARSHRDVILITDGEDQESYPVEAARKLGELGARLIAIGLGDENEGRRIPITGPTGQRTFMTHNGQEVWSRLDSDTLRKMVGATPGGRYLNVATGSIDFGDVYSRLIAGAGETDFGLAKFVQYEEKYQIFLSLAFFFLCLELCINERNPVKRAS
jgi:Ca-activated chloride channel family protein